MSEPEGELTRILGRYELGSAPSDELVPPLTTELVDAQRSGRPLAVEIVRTYTDLLYQATARVVGEASEDRPVKHTLLAPAGRLVSDEDPTRPAVPLTSQRYQPFPFNRFLLGDAGIHPHLHLAAAVRALAGLRSAEEAGGQDELTQVLDRAWFLLAFYVNINLRYGRMGTLERDLVVDLIRCCAHLHDMSDAPGPPTFVRDAADRDLLLRCLVQEWVTTRRYAKTDGETVNEGHHTYWDSGLPLPVGALLREHFGGPSLIPEDPETAIVFAREKSELGDFSAARAALRAAAAHPDYTHKADDLLRDLMVEEAARELAAILAENEARKGSPADLRVVEIGEKLHEAGGVNLMREVHAELTARQQQVSRALDMMWNGIGDWLG